MAAPLAPDFAESVLWQEQAPAHDEPGAEPQRPAARRDLPDRADVVVVGAGYAGVSAARELAAAGRDVLVLDAHPVGWGASTRNGGMVIPELTAGPAALERSLGPLGRRLYAEINEAFDHVEELTAGSAPLIACDYERTGQLYLAHAARLVPACRPRPGSTASWARRCGSSPAPSWAPRSDRSPTTAASSSSARAASTPHGSTAASWPGPGTPVPAIVGGARRALDRPPGRQRGGAPRDGRARRRRHPRDRGRRGRRVHERLRRRRRAGARPAGAAGRQLHHRHRGARPRAGPTRCSPRRRMLVDSKNFLFYWRLTPDGRVVFGGRRSLARSSLAQAREFLYASMVAVHPQLAGVAVARAWGGDVAVTLDRLPHVGRIDGAWYATGCNGSRRRPQHLAGHAHRAAPGRRRSAPGVRRAPAPAHPAAPLAPRVPPRRRPVLPLAGPRLPPLTPLAAHPTRQPEAMGSTPRARGMGSVSGTRASSSPERNPRLTGRGTRPGGMKRRASSIGPISPTSLPSGSATMA